MAERLAEVRKNGKSSKSFATNSWTGNRIDCGFEPKHIYMCGRYQGRTIYVNDVDLTNNTFVQYWNDTTFNYSVSALVQSYDGNGVTFVSINSEIFTISIIG